MSSRNHGFLRKGLMPILILKKCYYKAKFIKSILFLQNKPIIYENTINYFCFNNPYCMH
jgi:hypothetical protein